MNHTRILLVDDDPDDQFIFADTLDEIAKNVECVTANNGVEAIAYLNTANPIPSLIFLDLNMPIMSGHEFLKCQQQQAKAIANIPVIVMTAVPGAQVDGVAGLLRKPMEIGQIITIMNSIRYRPNEASFSRP